MGDAQKAEEMNGMQVDAAGDAPQETRPKQQRGTPCQLGCSKWCSKYFWEGTLSLLNAFFWITYLYFTLKDFAQINSQF